jgi:DNA methylase
LSLNSSTVPKSSPIPTHTASLPDTVFRDDKHHIRIFQGDCLNILEKLPADSIDLIFADSPYFLSNNGITCHAGRMVSVNKGKWEASRGAGANHEFNRAWLAACQRVLKPNGSIWVSGTSHVIHSVGFAMQQLEFKLLNDISWVKPNLPPNLSCRYFTHATETIIWAAKNKKSRHTFHYKEMKEIAGGKQMKSVWTIPPQESWEKKFGKHPTQKPVALLERILLASSSESEHAARRIAELTTPRNISRPTIRRTDSVEVHFHVRELKLNFDAEFPTIFGIFDSWDDARSFTVKYRLLAANIPRPVESDLHIIVETMQAAH